MSLIFALAASLCAAPLGRAAIVINEFQYDDSGTDNREFIELYNSGAAAVDISGWTVGTRDIVSGVVTIGSGASAPVAIPGAAGSGTTMLGPGGYYVIGNTGVTNVNQVVGGGVLENDTETVELWDGAFNASNLVDAALYEGSATALAAALPAGITSQFGQTYWGNHQGFQSAEANQVLTAVGRYRDGIDTNNNGRDFGLRPGSPGAANNSGIMTAYTPPNVDSLADGTAVAGLTGSFVGGRVITPGTVTAGLNPNAIPAPPKSAKAIIAWDNTGGGNAVVSNQIYSGAQQFALYAYLDTSDLPVSSNASAVQFRGSELTFYGLGGSIDAFTNLASVSGQVGLGAANSANGASGVAWYYEKVGLPVGGGAVSEKLYLIDAGDGGNMNTEGANTTADEWIVLQTIDLSAAASAWHYLSIAVDAAGNGVAVYDDQTFNFTTAPNLDGGLYVGYRENTQEGSVGVPGYLRPPTFAIPEPAAWVVAMGAVLGGFALAARRR
jgi:hypothetical protein